jgi:hypothetical protein
MKFFALFLICISFHCYALEHIDEKAVLDLLADEKKFIQNKDLDGLMSLMSEDFAGTDRAGKAVNKNDFKIGAVSSFMNASKLLHNSTIKSLLVSKDRKSAEIVLSNETKALIEMNGYSRVISNTGITKSLLIIENGTLRYKNNQYVSVP